MKTVYAMCTAVLSLCLVVGITPTKADTTKSTQYDGLLCNADLGDPTILDDPLLNPIWGYDCKKLCTGSLAGENVKLDFAKTLSDSERDALLSSLGLPDPPGDGNLVDDKELTCHIIPDQCAIDLEQVFLNNCDRELDPNQCNDFGATVQAANADNPEALASLALTGLSVDEDGNVVLDAQNNSVIVSESGGQASLKMQCKWSEPK